MNTKGFNDTIPIKTLSGEMIQCELNALSTVSALKEMVLTKTNIPTNQQFIFDSTGRFLFDHLLIISFSYNIAPLEMKESKKSYSKI
jgi:hypothetical protein